MAHSLRHAPTAKPKWYKHITGHFAVKETNGSQGKKEY
jgi:hypothetical protein